jgi:uncharacterized membrane protein
MNALSRGAAQQRADDIAAFGRELERLEREEVLALGEAQRRALREHHERLLDRFVRSFDIDRDTQAKQLSLGMRIASFLGALALAASVFFLFRQLWGLLSTATQVSILIASALGTLAATVWIQGRDETGYFANLAALVAFACFVLDIAMLGRVFDITPTDNALIPWGMLALLLAYACRLRLLLAAAILCGVAFVAARTGTWSGLYWLDFGERPENFFPAAALLFAVPLVVRHAGFDGAPQLYRIFALLTLFLPMLVLSNWGELSYLDLPGSAIEGAYQVLGFVLSAAAAWLGVRAGWKEVVNTGVTFFVIFLYTKFYDWWWEVMPKYLFFLVIGLTALLFLAVLRRLRLTATARGELAT